MTVIAAQKLGSSASGVGIRHTIPRKERGGAATGMKAET
jgi:hypothetical protein